MKTFNSTLAIVAIALTSVFSFTSCEKDNDAFNAPTPRQQRVEINSETFGTGSNATTTTTITTSDGTNTATSTTVTNAGDMVAATAKDFAGTYKYTSEDGKEWILVLTENAGSRSGHYSATITVPEGAPVAAKTYDGEYQFLHSTAMFHSNEKAGETTRNSTVAFGFTNNKENPKNTNVTLKFNGKTGGTFVFAKQ